MGTCSSAPGRYPDPATTDKTLLSADELMTRGISFAQLASVERSVERRISYLNYSRDFLRAALQRLPPNDRFDFAAAHIAAVLVTLGDDPHDLKGYLESVFSSGRSEKRSSIQVDEAALRVMEALAFASPAIEARAPRSRASPLVPNLPAGLLLEHPPFISDQQLIIRAVTLMEQLQFAKVSVRIYNNISGEEDMRFELPLRSFGSTVETFYARLGKYLAYFAAYDFSRLEYLMVLSGGKIKRRPEFDRASFLAWLETANESGILNPLMFCPVPSQPADTMDMYSPGIRILSCTPNKLSITPAEADSQAAALSTDQVAEVNLELALSKIPENRTFKVSLTDQRDSSRTFCFPAELKDERKLAIVKVPFALLRPRSADDAGVFDVHGVIDGRWRTENRKVLTVLVAGDPEPSDAD